MTPVRSRWGRRDDGFAMVAAVAAIAAFGYIALEVLASDRSAIAGLRAQADKARMIAAADAGLTTAIHGLGIEDRVARWPIDGRTRIVAFGDASLAITVEDERGKVPINDLDDDQARRLFEVGGAPGGQLDALTDAFLDWRDGDDDRRDHGAEAQDYAALRIRPRNGDFQSVDELRQLRGMTAAIYGRIAPVLTVNFGRSGGFSKSTARPLAIAVMTAGGEDSADAVERERELAGDRPELEIADDISLNGRALTVRVEATDRRGARAVRSAVVELTGDPAVPFWVRNLN